MGPTTIVDGGRPGAPAIGGTVDDISDIRRMYDGDVESEAERLDRHQLEYELTWRYLETYLPSGGHILEIGAAAGRYTLPLARRGYRVTAVDLSAGLLRENRRLAQADGLVGRIRHVQADARDLAVVGAGGGYDAALVMGPLYHLIYEDDRRRALEQVYGVLLPDAPLFTAWISRLGILGGLMRYFPEWIEERDEVRSVMERGHDPPDRHKGGFRGYFARAEEIAPLHESVGFVTDVLAGVEPAISADDEAYNVLEGERRRLWLDLLYEISAEPTQVAASGHLLYIGHKPSIA